LLAARPSLPPWPLFFFTIGYGFFLCCLPRAFFYWKVLFLHGRSPILPYFPTACVSVRPPFLSYLSFLLPFFFCLLSTTPQNPLRYSPRTYDPLVAKSLLFHHTPLFTCCPFTWELSANLGVSPHPSIFSFPVPSPPCLGRLFFSRGQRRCLPKPGPSPPCVLNWFLRYP